MWHRFQLKSINRRNTFPLPWWCRALGNTRWQRHATAAWWPSGSCGCGCGVPSGPAPQANRSRRRRRCAPFEIRHSQRDPLQCRDALMQIACTALLQSKPISSGNSSSSNCCCCLQHILTGAAFVLVNGHKLSFADGIDGFAQLGAAHLNAGQRLRAVKHRQ